jgi:WD40 repeat protein
MAWAKIMGSPDGRTGVCSTDDGEVRFWDIASGKQTQALLGHERITGLALTPDGQMVLAAKFGRGIEVWDVARQEELCHFGQDKYRVRSLAISPDGKTVLAGATDGTLRLWDLASGRELRRFAGHTNSVSSVAFSSDEYIAISGSWDGTLRLWRLD